MPVTDRFNAAIADRYRIERELGRRGMATDLAHDVRHDRKVAVKVLKPELAAVLAAERLLARFHADGSPGLHGWYLPARNGDAATPAARVVARPR